MTRVCQGSSGQARPDEIGEIVAGRAGRAAELLPAEIGAS